MPRDGGFGESSTRSRLRRDEAEDLSEDEEEVKFEFEYILI